MKQRKRPITDKQRLDWMKRNNEFELRLIYSTWNGNDDFREYELDIGSKIYVGKTPRQAIDAAIRDGKEV